MTFRDLLERADVAAAVRYMRGHGMADDVPEEAQVALYEDFAKRLLEIEPKKSDESVLLGHMLKDEILNEIDGDVLDVTVYDKKEVADGIAEIMASAEVNLETDDPKSVRKAIEEHRDLVRGYAFDFSEWNEVLGWEVDEANVAECGETAFVAFVLYEMSFNGVYEEDHAERRAELEERVAEVNEIFELDEEERNKRLVPMEKTFLDLGIVDERSEEEKRAERIAIDREILYNVKRQAEVLKGYVERAGLGK